MASARSLTGVILALLVASTEVHAFAVRHAHVRPQFSRAVARAPTMSAEPPASGLRASRAAALGGLALGALGASAPAARAAPVTPWALSEFMDAVDKDGVERVTFDDAGKALVAVDSDGGRHRVEVIP